MNLYAWFHFVTALVSGALAFQIWRRRAAVGGKAVARLMLAVTIWALAYGLELASTDLASMRFWIRVEYLGITTGPVFWLLFAIQYTGRTAWITRRSIAALFITPFLTILLNATNELHLLYYRAVAVDRSGPFPLLALQPGPWYWVHISYSFLEMLVGTLLLLDMWRQTAWPYRKQLSVIMVAASIPLAVNIIYLLGIRPLGHIDLTPLALTLTGVLIYMGLFRYSLFDLSPVARNMLFEQLHDAVLVLDQRDRIVDLNRTAQQLLGLDPSVIGQPIATALAAWPELLATCKNPDLPAEVQLARDSVLTFELRCSSLADGRNHTIGAMCVLHDITARKTLEQEREQLIAQLHNLAHTDELTGIANRRAFIEAAEREWLRALRMGWPITMLLLDIDHFKQVNDTYGHATGDRVLQAIAQYCIQQLRGIDLVGRYGGEEFVILLPQTELDAAQQVAERIREQIAALAIVVGTGHIHVTTSIGVATIWPPDATISAAIHQADAALYAAKRAGRNRVIIDSGSAV